jgi:hypothetical protein
MAAARETAAKKAATKKTSAARKAAAAASKRATAAVKKATAAKKAAKEAVEIPALETGKIVITIQGITPLVVHRFSEKSRKQMEDAQQGAPRHKKAPKKPKELFEASLYKISRGKYGFPASGFKKAMVSACRYADGITMTKAYGAFHVIGDLLPIRGSKPIMRTDVVRVGSFAKRTADIRYRGEFKNWEIKLPILYNKRIISPTQLAHLANLAGFSVGIGEWRPEKGGQFGMFEVH